MSVPATSHVVGGHPRATRGKTATTLLQVNRWNQQHDGPFTETALQQKLTALGYEPVPRAASTEVIVSARLHRRGHAEAVVAGLLRITLGRESVVLTAGDIVFVPRDAARRIEPVGNAPVLCIEAVSRSDP